MTPYPVSYSVCIGDDNDFSFLGEFTNGSQEVSYETCYNVDQSCHNPTASIASSFSEISSSDPTSPPVESPTEGIFEPHSSANSLGAFHHSRYGGVDEDEMWRVDSGGFNEGLSMSAIVETFNTQEVYSGGDPPSATSYPETHGHMLTSTPFGFISSSPLLFTQSMHNTALSTDLTGFWTPQNMIQGSSLDFREQGLKGIQYPTIDISSNRSTKSTATQTSDDLVIECT
ncbi:hypothetical protein N431DRAFT_386120, partial [Stipitochalara longipes BDJ]